MFGLGLHYIILQSLVLDNFPFILETSFCGIMKIALCTERTAKIICRDGFVFCLMRY